MAKLNVGIIGAARTRKGIGFAVLRTLLQNPDCEVKGIATRTAESAKKVAEQYEYTGNLYSIEDDNGTLPIEKIFQDDNIDMLFVMSPDEDHYPSAKTALEAGKAVFVDKPLTLADGISAADNLALSYELYSIAEKKNLPLILNCQRTVLLPHIKKMFHKHDSNYAFLSSDFLINVKPGEKEIPTGDQLWYDISPHCISMFTQTVFDKSKPIFNIEFHSRTNKAKMESYATCEFLHGYTDKKTVRFFMKKSKDLATTASSVAFNHHRYHIGGKNVDEAGKTVFKTVLTESDLHAEDKIIEDNLKTYIDLAVANPRGGRPLVAGYEAFLNTALIHVLKKDLAVAYLDKYKPL